MAKTDTFLEGILSARRSQVERTRSRTPLGQVREAAERRHERRDFAGALRGNGLAIIAELKQASPSRGVLRQDYRVREIAQGYEAAGAAALSVLTDEEFFRGSLTDLVEARDATGSPVLRKDFIVDEYQVYESVAAGADALLLIVAALPEKALGELIGLCRRLEIDVLAEIHNEAELDRALAAGAEIVGVNNRDLRTFEVRPETCFRLRPRIPARCLAVSESGIRTVEDLGRLADAGFNAALIGERLMTAPDPGEALAELIRGQKSGARSQQSAIRDSD